MDGYSGTISPPGMYVRALYDYDADDRTSLSFLQGDIIQVLTQLESGWWDGVVHGVRGWFPSNYCVVVSDSEAHRLDQHLEVDGDEADIESASDTDYENEYTGQGYPPREGAATSAAQDKEEEAAFWIPQATPEGKLYYFNTLTGDSTHELPLESPISTKESKQRDPSTSRAIEPPRPPPERMAGGYEREDDTDQSASEVEEPASFRKFKASKKRRSYLSDGASPATSMESLSRSETNGHVPAITTTTIPRSANAPTLSTHVTSASYKRYLGNPHALPLTWNRLTEDTRKSIERYRQAIQNHDRSEFVKRAEDISDHLRQLLAAGSGTTDNHSGIPSIISQNKALYPHFRDMMSRFSKLVLSSHIAAADFAASDSNSKCLQEAEGMLNGVYGFVEIARQQRGDEIPRIKPAFVRGGRVAGNWKNNGINDGLTRSISYTPRDGHESTAPHVTLDGSIIGRMDDSKRLMVNAIRSLQERLIVQEKVITHRRHKQLGNDICGAANKIIEFYKAWLSLMESIDLSEIGLQHDSYQMAEFSLQKQRIYVNLAELVISCQSVAAPLADEWSTNQGDTLEERLSRVRIVSTNLDTSTSQVIHSYQLFEESIPQKLSPPPVNESVRASTATSLLNQQMLITPSNRSTYNDYASTLTFAEPSNPAAGLYVNADNSKAKKFFGEAPMVATVAEEMPDFLSLEHEGEVQYDTKTDPPTIRGGTLTGLVEQLTRHDRYDAPFKTTFLMTYQSFTTAQELFEAFIRRWSIQPPSGITPENYQTWVEKKQALIRLRIVNVLKSWLDQYWMEGIDTVSMDLVTRIYNFTKDTIAASNTPGWKPLLNVVEQRMHGEDTASKKMVPNPNFQVPLPILPKNMKKLKFLDVDPTEFARQLTIIESRLYIQIKPHECLNKIWQKKTVTQEEPAVNVKALILHSNRLTNWVAEMILAQNELKKRVGVIKHFVAVADKCLALYNFSTLTSIISALGTAPITRLNRTWAQVNKATTAVLEKMRRMMGSTKNFSQYREALHQANPPCIPFFGVYLTDLTFIEDGIPGIIKETDLINFAKRAKTAEVIREIQTYQNVSYPFKAVAELQDYILNMMQSAGDVHEMYDRSLAVEPREREDEKIARLLSESGFL